MKEKNELRNIKFNKIYIFSALLIFIIIIVRIGILTLSTTVEGIDIQSFADNRTTRIETLPSKRGTIFDVKGNALAQNVSSYTLIAYLEPSRTTDYNNPQHVVDKEMTAEKLSEVLGIDKEQILSYLSRNAYQVEFGPKAKNLTELKKDEILALQLPGIDFIETQQRYYPYGNFLSYALGYVTKKDVVKDDGTTTTGELVGEMGIEAYCNDKLTGTNGYTWYQKDRNGYKIAGTEEYTVDAVDGNDVYLTIDSNIQLFAEQAISKFLSVSRADWISVMIADAKTGAILASATSPSFDPNKKDISEYLDHNVAYAFEPGSTMKIFSFMTAIENGVYNGSEKYLSGIFRAKDGTEIGDWYRNGWGYITYDAGFALSSNTAIMNLIDKYMSADMLMSYYKKLGFGSRTGIELPNEAAGKIAFKYQTEILNAGFGQGITVTPIQMIKAMTSISNNGILLKPYIIDKIVDHDTEEVIYEGQRTEVERVASEKTVAKIKELMRSAIDNTSDAAVGYYYYMDGYDIIGKTGTAEVAGTNGQGYNGGLVNSLAGMFPGNDPEVIFYVAIQNSNSGTRPMKELVQSIIKNVSKYLEIYDEDKDSSEDLVNFEVQSYINKNKSDVTAKLKEAGITAVVLGNGDTIVNQYPVKNTLINKIDKVFLLTDGNSVPMPNLSGYSVKDFISVANLLNLDYEIEGIGYLSKQSISAGTILDDKKTLKVEFNVKY